MKEGIKLDGLVNAAEVLLREARRNQALMDAAEVLKAVGSLETRVRETESALRAKREQLAAAEAELELLERAVKDGTTEMLEVQKRSEAEAQALKAQAHTEAVSILAEARARATDVVVQAQAEAVKVTEKARREAEEADRAAREAKDELAAVSTRRMAAQAELQGLNERIARAKSAAKAIVEGAA